MKFPLIFIFIIMPFYYSFSQIHEELGVKFILKGNLITIENLDKKFKEIKISEKDTATFVITELTINYQIEGSFIKDHILYTKNGFVEIEIMSDKIKKQIIFKRK